MIRTLLIATVSLFASTAMANNYAMPSRPVVTQQMMNHARNAIGISNAIGRAILSQDQRGYNRAMDAHVANSRGALQAYYNAVNGGRPIIRY